MSCKLRFHELALKEWRKMNSTIREQFKKKLAERLEKQRVPLTALSGMPNCYKIKLRQIGYRLIYRVEEDNIFVTVLSIGKREQDAAYISAKKTLKLTNLYYYISLKSSEIRHRASSAALIYYKSPPHITLRRVLRQPSLSSKLGCTRSWCMTSGR